MAFYLVKEVATGKKRMIEASAPANAVAHCAKDLFSAQRVEGAVLDSLKELIPVETIAKPKVEGEGEKPSDPPAGTEPAASGGKAKGTGTDAE